MAIGRMLGGLALIASAGAGALGGARWAEHAHRGSTRAPAEHDDRGAWEIEGLRARVRWLEDRLAAVPSCEVAAAPASDDAEPQAVAIAPQADASVGASPVLGEPVPQTGPVETVVGSAVFIPNWSGDTESRLVQAAQRLGGGAGTANVRCTHDECRLELSAADGQSAIERSEKLRAEVGHLLPYSVVEQTQVPGSATIVFTRRPRPAVTPGG